MIRNIDMGMATRLTREGRLNEAMAVLRGDGPLTDDTANNVGTGTIEMTRAPGNDGVWHQRSDGNAQETRPASRPLVPKVGLADLVRKHRRAGSPPPRAAIPIGAHFAPGHYAGPDGRRAYKLYVPSIYAGQPVPLLVMLHGCTQTPDDFALGTQMNALAEIHGFLVVYPEQSQSANMNRCWNWFNSADQGRDAGEPAVIAGLTRQIMAEYAIDRDRVFVAGLSAGGAMAAIMGAAYPDVFAAIGVHSGIAVGAAHDMPSAFAAMGGSASSAKPGKRHSVPTIVFHGDADRTVHVDNAARVLAQARGVQPGRLEVTTGISSGGIAYTRTVETGTSGKPALEHWLIHGAGHAWSGGHSAGSYTLPAGPDASGEMLRFFGIAPSA
ncbi:extracellular catalytic domain type 1 short-chain-length polyhydroxyalkanoate depolymerase [Asticcacaulis solisilvae]|uniref:extracellular catalytic domain type 1 short-chain-length polyhydroxyalkanoate depolymerase n=1 Tax=Asticcacaulis solisilvae TaxID=1217274 RepID=UPI003FD77C2D